MYGYMYGWCSFNDWKALGGCSCIREKVSNIIQTHCMIHCEMLAAKHLGQSLSDVLSSCVKIVNSITHSNLKCFQNFAMN